MKSTKTSVRNYTKASKSASQSRAHLVVLRTFPFLVTFLDPESGEKRLGNVDLDGMNKNKKS